MTRLPFSLLTFSERMESVIGAIQTSLAMVPDHQHRAAEHQGYSSTAADELAAWRAHQPYLQQIASYSQYNHSVIGDHCDGASSSSNSLHYIDGSDTCTRGEDSRSSYYTAHEDHMRRETFRSCSPLGVHNVGYRPYPGPYVLGGKILPDIANFDREDYASGDSDSGSSCDTDTETFYSYDPSSPTAARRFTGPRPSPTRTPDISIALEGLDFRPLSPPPLRHSGKTRSRVVSVPRDAPGTCP
ncbi:hypothetical protein H0H81_006384 [Sphagnurus paluster]|uniref:Uncharacterized protein n=1 Tax=Sphagnurus paluster TaxID=117069 RepID=A0A9P7FQY5_9AGAR|nr:hypothetical protein H0H81_006384 [Sphagnurus paluster]